MGLPPDCELVEVSESKELAVFDSCREGKPRKILALRCTPEELNSFSCALTAHPFGEDRQHRVWFHGISQDGKSLNCHLRIASRGSRKDVVFPVAKESYEGLEYVLRHNADDPELIPDIPQCIEELAANPSSQPTIFGGG